MEEVSFIPSPVRFVHIAEPQLHSGIFSRNVFYPESYLIILLIDGGIFQCLTDYITFLVLLLDQHRKALTCDTCGAGRQHCPPDYI